MVSAMKRGEYKTVSVRVPNPLWEQLKDVGHRYDRSLNYVILRMLENSVGEEENILPKEELLARTSETPGGGREIGKDDQAI